MQNNWEWDTQFCGIKMSHNYYVHHIFSEVMDNNDIQQIIELGTYHGGMSVVLGLEGVRKNVPVCTFDISDSTTQETKNLFRYLKVHYHLKDIFEPNNRAFIIGLLKSKRTYLVCDNGRKAEEFEAFGRHLISGSVISAHDYTTEFHDKDIEPIKEMLIPFMQEDWMLHDSKLATWKIK